VDDVLVAGNSLQGIQEVKSKLMGAFKTRDLGDLKYFLGIKITRDNGIMYLNQGSYLRKLLRKFKMENCAPVKTPMLLHGTSLIESKPINGEKPYRELIGSLMYACMATRPDICAAVNYFSQYQSNPLEEHWKGLKRILRYIQGTLDLSLCYTNQSKSPLAGYADADFANGSDRKSVTGFVIDVFGNLVSWCTRKQRTVALSTTEVEFVSLATASAEVLWVKMLLGNLGLPLKDPIPVYEDNQSCIHSSKSWDQRRMKHIDVKYNFVRDLQEEKIFHVQYISTHDQKADIMTKPLAPEFFNKHRSSLGLTIK